MNDPLWRTVLCWGTVITFLSAPLLVFILHIVSDEVPWLHFSQHIKEYGFMVPFFQSITALVFGLAGLHSWDKRIANGRHEQDASRHPLLSSPSKSKRND
jgi:hypothetical protein